MTDTQAAPTTPATRSSLTQIGVVMFAVADQDAARDFSVDVLGFEVRSDSRFGEGGAMRWLEVAPPGSRTRLALDPPMSGTTGGGGMIGVQSSDVLGEHARLSALGGVDLDPAPVQEPGAPLVFVLRDPDSNAVVVVEEA